MSVGGGPGIGGDDSNNYFLLLWMISSRAIQICGHLLRIRHKIAFAELKGVVLWKRSGATAPEWGTDC